MTTRDKSSFLNDNQQSFVNGSSQTDNSIQYSNLKLNQNHKSLISHSGQSFSKFDKDKLCAPLKVPNSTASDNFEEKGKSQAWNKSFDLYLKIAVKSNKEEIEKRWKKESSDSNNSILSLHITAYENSTEAVSNHFNDKNVEDLGKEKFGTTKPIVSASTLFIQNPFEFPRQQNFTVPQPEVSQFKAFQHLVTPTKVSDQIYVTTASEPVSSQHSLNDFPSINSVHSIRSIESVAGTPTSSNNSSQTAAECYLTGLEKTTCSFSPISDLFKNGSQDSADEDEWLKSDSTQKSEDETTTASKKKVGPKTNENLPMAPSKKQQKVKVGLGFDSGNKCQLQNLDPTKKSKNYAKSSSHDGKTNDVLTDRSKAVVLSPQAIIQEKELRRAKKDVEIAVVRKEAALINYNARVLNDFGNSVKETKNVVEDKQKISKRKTKSAKPGYDDSDRSETEISDEYLH